MIDWLNEYINKRNQDGEKLKPIDGNIYDIYFEQGDIGELFAFLTAASASRENIYRGISHDEYGIISSHRLFREKKRYEEWSVHEDISGVLKNFEHALNHLREEPVNFSNLELLEYARHMGVPTPIIDFSRSPFIGLFFAFCEPRTNELFKEGYTDQYALLNIIEQSQLAQGYLEKIEKEQWIGSDDRNRFEGYDRDFCKERFEANILQIIKSPSTFNTRMKNQQGLFLYDTLSYGDMYGWGEDFEDMISKLPNYPTSYPAGLMPNQKLIDVTTPILIRVHINIKLTSAILTMLDRMNINAFSMFPDDTGAAMHAKLTHYYFSAREVNKKE